MKGHNSKRWWAEFALLCVLCWGVVVFFISATACRAGNVDINPFVSVESRLKSTHGAGATLGVIMSPAPERNPYRPAPLVGEVYIPHQLEKPKAEATDKNASSEGNMRTSDDPQEITVETPFGPVSISLGSGVIALLAMFLGQKLGWIPIPTPKEKATP